MNYFTKLYAKHHSLALITWGYLIIAIGSLLVAGIFALMDQNLGRSILFVPLLAFFACAGNIVIWALIKLIIDTINDYKAAKTTPSAQSTKKSNK